MNTTQDMGYGAAHLARLLTRTGTEVQLVHDPDGWFAYTGMSFLARFDTVAAELLANKWIEPVKTSCAANPRAQRYDISAAGRAALAARNGTETPA
jgi:hypothetical protein